MNTSGLTKANLANIRKEIGALGKWKLLINLTEVFDQVAVKKDY